MHITEQDIKPLETWLDKKLNSIRLPDWEDSTVENLTAYVSLLVQRDAPESELRDECSALLGDFLDSRTPGFVAELFDTIRKRSFWSFVNGGANNSTAATKDRDDRRASGPRSTLKPDRTGAPATTITSADKHVRNGREDGQPIRGPNQNNLKRKRQDRAGSPSSFQGQRNKGGSSQPFPAPYPNGTNGMAAGGPRSGGDASGAFGPVNPDSFGNGFAQNVGPTGLPNTFTPGLPFDMLANPFLMALQNPAAFGQSGSNPFSNVCPNLQLSGFCIAPNCTFPHPGSISNPVKQNASSSDPAPETSRGRKQKRSSRPHKRDNKQVMILNIPPERFNADSIHEYYKQFGTITDLILYNTENVAVVAYNSNPSAFKALSSPEPVFNNRFVRTKWFNGELPAAKYGEATALTSEPPIHLRYTRDGEDGAEILTRVYDALPALRSRSQSSGPVPVNPLSIPTEEEAAALLALARANAQLAEEKRRLLAAKEEELRQLAALIGENEKELAELRGEIVARGGSVPPPASNSAPSYLDHHLLLGTSTLEPLDPDSTTETLLSRRAALEAELAALEAAATKPLHQGSSYYPPSYSRHQKRTLDLRPRRLSIQLVQPSAALAEKVRAVLNLATAQPVTTVVEGADESAFAGEGQGRLVLGFEEHWQARIVLDGLVEELGREVRLAWADGAGAAGGAGGRVMGSREAADRDDETGVFELAGSSQGGEREEAGEEEQLQDLDVAEEEDWV